MTTPLLRADSLCVTLHGSQGRRTVIDTVDLTVGRGETVGIVGESGSGKSITARAIAGLLPKSMTMSGTLDYDGADLPGMPRQQREALRGREIGMVFQDPFTMLNPLLRVGRHVNELLRDESGRRLSRQARRKAAQQRLAEVGITDPAAVDAFPFQLSGGMRQRVGIAAALARDPQLLIADEISTALDVTTQAELLALLAGLQASRQMSMIFITHDLRVAFSVCDRVYVMYAGRIVETAEADELERRAAHPYSVSLLAAEPSIERRADRLPVIPGGVPRPDEVSGCCAFADRCQWVEPACRGGRPDLLPVAAGHWSACLRSAQLSDQFDQVRATQPALPAAAVPRTGQEPLVHAEELRRTFVTGHGERTRRVLALDGVSLQIHPGESVGIVGESGSGKTTLGRVVAGLERPDSGRLLIDGTDVSPPRPPSRSALDGWRRVVQIVFQDPYSSLNPARTVRATLREALGVRAGHSSLRTPEDLVKLVGLPVSCLDRRPLALSGGERQRVAIARAVAPAPRLIVCDEPVSALDVSVQAQVLNLLTELRDEFGLSLLFITHDLAVVRQVADTVHVVHLGRIVESGRVDDVLDRPAHDYTKRLIASIPRSEHRSADQATSQLPRAAEGTSNGRH